MKLHKKSEIALVWEEINRATTFVLYIFHKRKPIFAMVKLILLFWPIMGKNNQNTQLLALLQGTLYATRIIVGFWAWSVIWNWSNIFVNMIVDICVRNFKIHCTWNLREISCECNCVCNNRIDMSWLQLFWTFVHSGDEQCRPTHVCIELG